jgi:hypothetical protein
MPKRDKDEQAPSETSPVAKPPEVDPDWQDKIELAREARKLGEELRKDKATSFRRSVGRAA